MKRAEGLPATIGELRRLTATRLRAGWANDGTQRPELDARLLVGHVVGSRGADIALRDDEIVGPEIVSAVAELAARRSRGEPVARIVGTKEFWGLTFRLSPGTLVPRPDTETVVEVVLDRLKERGQTAPQIVDLGTGSGCILLALLSEVPGAFGVGTDMSFDALATATTNARCLGLERRAAFVRGDWTDAIGGLFDVVVANPPYVAEDDLPELPVEVIGHDPRLALAGGPDGLDPYRMILPKIPGLLAPGGCAVVEFGAGQGEAVAEIGGEIGLIASVHRDLAGRDRVICFAR